MKNIFIVNASMQKAKCFRIESIDDFIFEESNEG